MQKIIILFIALISTAIAFSGCDSPYTLGEFEANESMLPDPNPNPPQAPTGMIASYDDYCDRIDISWDTIPRASSYSVYMGETIIAEDISETSFTYFEAPDVETEYRVFANNHNGSSLNYAAVIGKRGGIPDAPTNFSASKGTSASVILTWDETEHAQWYQLLVEGNLLADSITTTYFLDENGPLTLTEYSLKAYSVCGASDWVTDYGRAGVATEFIDDLNNLDLVHSSNNMQIQTNNPHNFGDDAGRAQRISAETADLTYYVPGIFDFSVDVWILSAQGISSNLKVYVSSDGVSFIEVPTKQSVLNLGNRSLVTLTPDGIITDANYLKVEKSGTATLWWDQIARVVIKHIN